MKSESPEIWMSQFLDFSKFNRSLAITPLLPLLRRSVAGAFTLA